MTTPVTSPFPDRATITKVLIANRGEIAVRIARACRDAGRAPWRCTRTRTGTRCTSRRPTRRTRWAALRRGDTYLVIEKLLDVARPRGADAVHPGYGFLAENAGSRRR